MDLTEQQEAALQSVQEHFDPGTFDEALQERADDFRQPAFDEGHQSGFGEVNRKLEKKEQKVQELQESVSEYESRVEELREEQPDLQAKRQEWEENELQPMREKVETLQSKLTDGKKETVQQKLVSGLQGQVTNDWVAKQAVKSHSDRIEVSEDGEVQFLREDGETPYPSQNGKEPRERFQEDLLESAVPDDLVTDSSQGGGRSIEGEGAGGGTGGNVSRSEMSDADRAEFIAEHGKDEYLNLPE